jgi:hypothetical protein
MNTEAEPPLSAEEVSVLLAILEPVESRNIGLSGYSQSRFYEKSDKKAGKYRFQAKTGKYAYRH